MGVTCDLHNFIDVICQHTKEGDIIPLRIRLEDEDGIMQTFNIKGYKELTSKGRYVSPYGTIVHSHTWSFICKIQVLNSIKEVELFYNSNDNLWRLTRVI